MTHYKADVTIPVRSHKISLYCVILRRLRDPVLDALIACDQSVTFTEHDLGFCHDLRFFKFRKCSFAFASATNAALPDGALRVQEHAAGSTLYDYPCFGEHIFTRLQSGETYRRFQKVSA